jgi:hypothetical protein
MIARVLKKNIPAISQNYKMDELKSEKFVSRDSMANYDGKLQPQYILPFTQLINFFNSCRQTGDIVTNQLYGIEELGA